MSEGLITLADWPHAEAENTIPLAAANRTPDEEKQIFVDAILHHALPRGLRSQINSGFTLIQFSPIGAMLRKPDKRERDD
jgi:hypothetical protein